MIKTLRKRQLLVWQIMAVLMPLGIISAVLVVPKPPSSKLLQPPAGTPLPLLLKTIKKQGYTVNLRASADTAALQLEWINNTIFNYPSALIYKVASFETNIDKGGDSALVVARIESRSVYYFPVKKDAASKAQFFVVYDIIHHQKIDSLTF